MNTVACVLEWDARNSFFWPHDPTTGRLPDRLTHRPPRRMMAGHPFQLDRTMSKPKHIETRADYRVFSELTTRWKDNDVYGHVNNAEYNSWMDTAVTQFFRRHWSELPNTPIIPVAGETRLSFHRPISHPADVQTGFRVEHIGNSSVRCGVGVFVKGEDAAAAWGHMIHVWVDRETNQAVPIPDIVRSGLQTALV